MSVASHRLQLAESNGATLDLDAPVDAEQRHGDVAAAEAATGGTAQRDTLSAEAVLLQEADHCALGSVSLSLDLRDKPGELALIFPFRRKRTASDLSAK
jgi:hypothetical protein